MKILLTRPADASPQTLAEYRAEGGYVALERALAEPGRVLAEIEAAGLRGHGGAAFPAARKWRLAAQQQGDVKHVVANGGEHEPGSCKDRFLVERYPHKVLEGMLLCGFATGARTLWLYLIEDMAPQLASAERALAELRAAGLGAGFEFRVHRAPATYVAGEETAALQSIEGKPAKPRKKPPYPGEAGVGGAPTTVNNVETLAHVPWIVREGAAAYRAVGTAGSPGTMLFTLPATLRHPGVHEVAFGTTWRDLVFGIGGGPRDGRAIRALQPALSCGFLPAEHFDAPIDHDSCRMLGTAPGCGGLTIVQEGDDVIARVLEIAQFFMAEQCGQCPPCRMETNQIVHVLKGVAAGKPGDYRGAIEKVTGFAFKKGWCSLIEMAAAPVLSALKVFAQDFAARTGS